jgi:hypothetical protein
MAPTPGQGTRPAQRVVLISSYRPRPPAPAAGGVTVAAPTVEQPRGEDPNYASPGRSARRARRRDGDVGGVAPPSQAAQVRGLRDYPRSVGLTQVVSDDADFMAMVAKLHEETVLEIAGTVAANEKAPGRRDHLPGHQGPLRPGGLPAVRPLPARRLGDPAGHPRSRSGLAAAPEAAGALHPGLRIGRGLPVDFGPAGVHRDFSPKIVGSVTESGANVFSIDYFGKPATSRSRRSSTSRPW